MDGTSMLLSVLFGAVGTGYFIYGKKQNEYIFLIAGIILGLYSWFVTDVWLTLLIGLVVSIAPFKLREYF